MPLEGKNWLTDQAGIESQGTAQELPQEESFGAKAINFVSKIPGVGFIANSGRDAYNYVTGNEQEKQEIATRRDNSLGGFFSSAYNLFTGEKDQMLDDDEVRHADTISGFQKNLSKNPFTTLGISQLVGFDDSGIKFKKGDKSEFQARLAAVENEPLSEELNVAVQDYYKRFNDRLAEKVDNKLIEELRNAELAQNATLVAQRRSQLLKEMESEVSEEFDEDTKNLQKRVEDYRDISRRQIADAYIQVDEGEDALESFRNNYSTNASQRTDQYIMEEIVSPIMQEIADDLGYDVQNNADPVLGKMQDKMQEKLLRDYKHYFENLAPLETPESRAKVKGMLLPQLEARKKLFEGVIKNYEQSYSELDDLSNISNITNFTRDELIKNAYKDSFNSLSQEEQNALITRDGMDTMAQIYHDYKEAGRRLDEGGIKGGVLFAGNVIQQALGALGGVVGAGISGAASETIKRDDFSKVYLDEYELSTDADNPGMALLKHATYNIDDLAEVIIPTGVSSKFNVASKGVQKGSDALRILAEASKRNPKLKNLQGAIQFTEGGLQVGLKGLQGVTEALPANTIIDRQLRAADTDANAYVNVVSDFLLEPVIFAVGKRIPGSAASSAAATTGAAKSNFMNQNILSLVSGELPASDAIKKMVKESEGSLTKQEATQLLAQGRDLVYKLTGKNTQDVFRDPQALYRNITSNYEKLRDAAKNGSDKLFTPEGTILKLEDLTTSKLQSKNEISQAYELLESSDQVEKDLGAARINKLIDDVEGIIKGDLQYQSSLLKLSKQDQKEQLARFQNMIANIKQTDDIELKKNAMFDMYSKLTDLRNSNVNKAFKTQALVSVYNPITGYSVKIPVEKFDNLLTYGEGQEAYDKLVVDGVLNVGEAESEILGISPGQYRSGDSKGTLLGNLNNKDRDLFKIVAKALTPGKKGSYAVGIPKDQLETTLEGLEEFFGGRASFINLDLKKITKGRDEINERMLSSESEFSIAYGTQPDKLDKTKENVILYIGAGRELYKKGFDFGAKGQDYPEKSAEVLKDILSRETFEEGIDFARPINNITKYETITSEYKQEFIDKKLLEAGYASDAGGILTLTEKGRKIKDQIIGRFQLRNKDTLSKFSFEVFATKMINNYDLFAKVFQDIDRLNNGGKANQSEIIKTVEGLNDLINAFASRGNVSRSAEKHLAQFNMSKYRTEANKAFKEIELRREARLVSLKNRKSTILNRIRTASEEKMVQRQLDYLNEQIAKIESVQLDKKAYTDKYLKNIYNQSFEDLFKRKMIEATQLLKGIKADDLKPAAEMKEIVERIDDIEKEIKFLSEQNTGKLSETEVNALKEKRKSKNEQLKELQSKLNEIDSKIENEIKVIRQSSEFEKLVGDINKKEFTLNEVYDIANKHAESFIKYPQLQTFFLNAISTKTRKGTGSLFSKEAIKFVSKEELKKQINHLVDNQRDFYLAKDESPLLKVFGTAFSGADNSEQGKGYEIFRLMRKEFGATGVKNMKEMYFKTPAFKEFIDSLRVDGKMKGNVEKKAKENFFRFKSFLDKYIDTLDYILVKDGKKLSKEDSIAILKQNKKVYDDLYKRFKSLSNSVNTGVKMVKYLDGYNKQGYPIYKIRRDEGIITDKVILTEDMKKGFDGNFRVINVSQADDLKYMTYTYQGKEVTINSVFSKLANSKKQNKEFYNTSKDILEHVIDTINNRHEHKAGTLPAIRAESYMSWLGLDKDEYMMGTYGDKDNSLQVYKSEKTNIEEIISDFTSQYSEIGGFVNVEDKLKYIESFNKDNEKVIKTSESFYSKTDKGIFNKVELLIEKTNPKTGEKKNVKKSFVYTNYKNGIKVLNSISDINKRETALVSSQKVFEDVELPTKTYIIGEEVFDDSINEIIDEAKELAKDKNKAGSDVLTAEFYDRLIEIDKTLDNPTIRDYTLKDFVSYIDTTYGTDLFDGTSYMSKELAELHDVISTGTARGKDKAKKFHYTGLTKDNERYLGKTLFNRADIKISTDDGFNDAGNAVLIGESSVKLKGGYKKFSESSTKTAIVNGRKFKVVGEIQGTNTSSFRDASADSYREREEQTISEQVINNMDYDVRTAYEKVVEKEIKDLYQELMGGVGNYDVELPTFGDTNIFLNNLKRVLDVGGTTDSMIQARIKQFLDGAKRIIEGNKAAGISNTILHSTIKLPSNAQGKSYLKRNEVVVSKNNHLYKNAVRDIEKRIEELNSKEVLNDKEKASLEFLQQQLDKNEIWVTGFRNPVPNKENLGVYKLVLAEEVGYNHPSDPKKQYVKSDDVILHPESTYMKIQGDNDGDHFLMIPVVDEKSELIARTGLGMDMQGDLYGTLSSGNFKNTVAVVEQIEAPKGEVVEQNIIQGRLKNLEAKVTISTASSVIRGLGIMRQYIQQIKGPKDPILDIVFKGEEVIESEGKIIAKAKNYTLKDILDDINRFEGKEVGDYKNVLIFDETYGGKVASILQLVLDFAKDKSGKPFPKDKWIAEVTNAAGIKNPETIKFLFNNILSPLAASHKQATKNMTVKDIYKIWGTKKKPIDENKFIIGTMGYRRNVTKYFSQNFVEELVNMRNTLEPRFILDKMDFKNAELKALVKRVSKIGSKFLGQGIREDILSTFEKLKENPAIKKITDDYDRLYKLHTNDSGRTDFAKIFKELKVVNSNGELIVPKRERDLLALYSMGDGNSTMFNLLNDSNRVDLLEYSEQIRIKGDRFLKSVGDLNNDYTPTVFLSKIGDTEVLKEALKSEKEIIENKILSISEDINEIKTLIQDGPQVGLQGLYDELEELSDIKNQLEGGVSKVDDLEKKISKNLDKLEMEKQTAGEFRKEATTPDQEINFVDGLDISYNINGEEFSELMAQARRINDVETLFNAGVKLKNVNILEQWSEDEVQKMNTARSVFGKESTHIKKLDVQYQTKIENDFKKIGSLEGKHAEALKILRENTKQFFEYTDEGYRFNQQGYLDDVEKKLKNKDNTRLELYSAEEKDIVNELAKEYRDLYVSLADGLTKMDTIYKDQGGYKVNYHQRVTSSFTDDLIEAFQGDLTFEFRRKGIITHLGSEGDSFVKARKEFNDYMKEGADNRGSKYSLKDSNKLFEYLFQKNEPSKTVGMIKEVQGLYYHTQYQATSLLLGGTGHIAGLTQVLGNAIEVLAYARKAGTNLKEINEGIDFLRLTAEDTAGRGQGVDLQGMDKTKAGRLQQITSKGIKSIVDQIAKKLGMTDVYSRNRIANIIDTSISEPLLATDMLQDVARRQAAMSSIMDAYGFKTFKDLQEGLPTQRDKDRFASHFYRKYNEIGGGVISLAPIYRETSLTNISTQQRAYQARKIFAQLFMFLNGWSINKVTTIAEKNLLLPEALNLYRKGDVKGAKALMKEFVEYNTAMLKNIGLAAGLAMKFEKHDFTKEDDQIDNKRFIQGAVNTYAALEILFDRELENLKGYEGQSITGRLAATTYGMLKHMTRELKLLKIPATTVERMEIYDEGWLEAFYGASQSVVGSYMRSAHGLTMGNIYNEASSSDNISLFGYGLKSRTDEAIDDFQKANRAGKLDSVGLLGSSLDLFMSYLKPQYLGDEGIQKGVNKLISDKNIQALYNHGIGPGGYDLNNILLTDGKVDSKYVNDAWTRMIVYQGIGTRFDDKMRKTNADPAKLYDQKMDDIITKQLEEMGYTKDDLVNKPLSRTEALQKLYFEVQQGNIPELSTKHLISYIANNKYSEFSSAYKKQLGITYDDKFKFEESQKDYIKYAVLKDMEESGILNLNLENLQVVSGLHISKNQPELSKTFIEARTNSGVQHYMDGLLLATQNLKDGDTSAKYLIGKYNMAMKGVLNYYANGQPVKPSAEALEIVADAGLKLIGEVYNSSQPMKEQTAKIAAILNGMNTAGWNMFRDNEKFNLLTLPAQRKLLSWVYRTNNELQSYDANSISNYPTSMGSKGKNKNFSNYFRKGMGSGYTSGARPGFAKQFPQLKEFMQGKPIPENYEQIATGFLPNKPLQLRYLHFPIIKAMNNYFIQQTYSELTQSVPGKIITRKAQPKTGFVKTKKKKVKLPRTRKPAAQKTTIRKTTMKGLPGDISER